MRKRAGFARALVMEPDIVIFDEPDSGLDPVRTALLCDLIQEMHAIHRGTYIVVTHNIASARQIGEYIARAVARADRRSGRRREDVLLGEPVRAPVPQRLRRGAADDGLSRAHGPRALCRHLAVAIAATVDANICSYGRLRAPPPLRAGRGRRRALAGRSPDAGRARAGGGAAGRRRAARGGGLGGRGGARRGPGDGPRRGARPLP